MDGREKKIFNIEDVKSAKEMGKQILALGKEQQRVILWIICRYDFLELIDSGRIMSEEEEREWMEKAITDGDYMLMGLIEFKKQRDQKRDQKKFPLTGDKK